jgi:hypothetical protein
MTKNPPLYSKSLQLGHVTVADSVGETFQSGYIPQQAPVGTSQYSSRPIDRPLPAMDHQSYGTGLSQDTIMKIQELKRLVYKYTQFHNNDPDQIVRLVVYYCINGDNTLLDQKLAQLHRLDGLPNNNF